jgi:serine O-acetyltransferase
MGVVIGETAEVGNDCTIYQGVTLGGTTLTRGAKRHPTLESGVIVGANAQVLGGFTVGSGARIGSNAVVVKPVPAGATAVGNPARILAQAAEREEPANASASSSGFSAYGLTQGDDPLARTLKALMDEMASQAQQLELLKRALVQATSQPLAEASPPNTRASHPVDEPDPSS